MMHAPNESVSSLILLCWVEFKLSSVRAATDLRA